MTSLRHFLHLVRRFLGAVTARVDPAELSALDDYLSLAEQQLFRLMPVADQRHALDLFHWLRRDGHSDPDLLRAALLHDVGKALGRLPLAHRVIFSFTHLLSDRLALWLAEPARPRWCRPFYLAAYHAELGAQAAARAGSNPRVVALIAQHGAPGRDPLSRLLYRYDGEI